jgi:hypothetical protein
MRINHTKIKRRKRNIRIRKRNEHRPINRRIPLVRTNIRLDRLSIVHAIHARDVRQRRVRDVQLADPDDELRGAGRSGGHVAVVGPDGLPGFFPGEEDFAARVGEREGAVLGDGGGAVEAGYVAADAGLVGGDVA